MLVYIAGPITGVDNYKTIFAARAASLRALGYQVENPVLIAESLEKKFPDKKLKDEDYMLHDLTALLECDGISMLDGWENSKGAKVEYEVAKATGKVFVDVKILEHKWNSEGK